MIAVSKKLKSSMCKILNNDDMIFEQLFVIIKHNNCSTIVGAVYIPPTYDINIYQDHIMYMEDLTNYYKNCNFIIMGDFNLAEVSWSNNIFSFNNKTTSFTRNCCNILVNTYKNFNMLQFNEKINVCDNVLDLVFSNNTSKIYLSTDVLTNVYVFHPALFCEIDCKNFYNNSVDFLNYDFCKHNFKKCDFIKINSQLNTVDWDMVFDDLNVIDATCKFYNILHKIIDENVPKHKLKKSFSQFGSQSNLKI